MRATTYCEDEPASGAIDEGNKKRAEGAVQAKGNRLGR
jgi:hypothetical protein